MVDTLSRSQRSARMALIRSKGSKLERMVMGAAHRMGYRYRKHQRALPGTPDMVFPARRKAIFVHGCFWHGHRCGLGRLPKSRVHFWTSKIAENRKRDRRASARLRGMGWRSLVVWECQTRDLDKVAARMKRFLDAKR